MKIMLSDYSLNDLIGTSDRYHFTAKIIDSDKHRIDWRMKPKGDYHGQKSSRSRGR